MSEEHATEGLRDAYVLGLIDVDRLEDLMGDVVQGETWRAWCVLSDLGLAH